MKKSMVLKICLTGIMGALVFVSSSLRIPIPLPVGNTAIHLGNIFCILSGLLLGGVYGGLAAGIGSFIYDLTNPLYVSTAIFTFTYKFFLAFVCGYIAHRKDRNALSFKHNITGAILGSLTYIMLYLNHKFLENILFLNVEVIPALAITGQAAIVSLINAVMAVIISVPLFSVLRKALNKSNIGLF